MIKGMAKHASSLGKIPSRSVCQKNTFVLIDIGGTCYTPLHHDILTKRESRLQRSRGISSEFARYAVVCISSGVLNGELVHPD